MNKAFNKSAWVDSLTRLEGQIKKIQFKKDSNIKNLEKEVLNAFKQINSLTPTNDTPIDGIRAWDALQEISDLMLQVETTSQLQHNTKLTAKAINTCLELECHALGKEEAQNARISKQKQLIKEYVIATQNVIKNGTGFDGAWIQGKQCCGRTLIDGWPGDDAWATIEAEGIEETLRIVIQQRSQKKGIEIDKPIGWNPRNTSCMLFSQLRLFNLPDEYVHKDKADWSKFPCEIFDPNMGEGESL